MGSPLTRFETAMSDDERSARLGQWDKAVAAATAVAS